MNRITVVCVLPFMQVNKRYMWIGKGHTSSSSPPSYPPLTNQGNLSSTQESTPESVLVRVSYRGCGKGSQHHKAGSSQARDSAGGVPSRAGSSQAS